MYRPTVRTFNIESNQLHENYCMAVEGIIERGFSMEDAVKVVDKEFLKVIAEERKNGR